MAWRRLGDKPLSEPVMVSLLTHICITQPQWVKRHHLMGPIINLGLFDNHLRFIMGIHISIRRGLLGEKQASDPGLPTSKILFPYFVEKISVFLITFPYPLICSSSDSKQSLWQLPIYSGGTHWLPVETLVDSFGTTGTGSEDEHVLLPHVEERREREREIKFIGLFENRGHRGPYSPYKPFNHNLYIGIIIFPHIDNPQYTGYDLPKREEWMFWWLKRYLKVLRHKIPQILTDLQPKTGKLCSGSSTLSDRTDRAQFPYFEGQIRTPVFCM